jgi:hypothetical protein
MTQSRTRQDTPRPHVPEDVRQHLDAARAEMRKSLETILPEGFFVHRDAARREILLAGRSVLDAALRRMDEKKSQA